jgi:enoyl-CoA hydratase/carnithine racemase
MTYKNIELFEDDWFAMIVMNRPERRNALSLDHMKELIHAFQAVGTGSCRGVILAAKGSVFCSGHDFADMAGRNLNEMRALLNTCTELMTTIQSIPQPVIARVHGLATAAGCQLVATCDLVVASEKASFATPGGKGGWFCTTPMVAVSRAIGRKRALEMLMTGDPIDAKTAEEWGLVNKVVPENRLDEETRSLLERATRGSALSKGIGKQAFYAQIDLDQPKAYNYAVEVMASTALTEDAQEGMKAFLEKRQPVYKGR